MTLNGVIFLFFLSFFCKLGQQFGLWQLRLQPSFACFLYPLQLQHFLYFSAVYTDCSYAQIEGLVEISGFLLSFLCTDLLCFSFLLST